MSTRDYILAVAAVLILVLVARKLLGAVTLAWKLLRTSMDDTSTQPI